MPFCHGLVLLARFCVHRERKQGRGFTSYGFLSDINQLSLLLIDNHIEGNFALGTRMGYN